MKSLKYKFSYTSNISYIKFAYIYVTLYATKNGTTIADLQN